jgi:hypothetical protein
MIIDNVKKFLVIHIIFLSAFMLGMYVESDLLTKVKTPTYMYIVMILIFLYSIDKLIEIAKRL